MYETKKVNLHRRYSISLRVVGVFGGAVDPGGQQHCNLGHDDLNGTNQYIQISQLESKSIPKQVLSCCLNNLKERNIHFVFNIKCLV